MNNNYAFFPPLTFFFFLLFGSKSTCSWGRFLLTGVSSAHASAVGDLLALWLLFAGVDEVIVEDELASAGELLDALSGFPDKYKIK